MNTEQRFRARN